LTSRASALAGLLVTALVGGLGMPFAMLADGTVTPFTATVSGTWTAVAFALQTFLWGLFGFAWFMHDRAERGYPRSTGFNVGLILFSVITGPVYLWRSRAAGRRVPAILAMFGILLASWIIMVATTLVGLVLVAIVLGLQ